MKKKILNNLSRLVFISFVEYYKNFKKKKLLLNLISKDILTNKEGEISNYIYVLNKKKNITGAIFYYNFDEFKKRSLSSLFKLKPSKQTFFKIVKISNKIERKIYNRSLYISRFAIFKRFKRMGYGSILINKIVKLGKKNKKKKILLHVNIYNKQAIKFYKKKFFLFSSKSKKYRYKLMYRKI